MSIEIRLDHDDSTCRLDGKFCRCLFIVTKDSVEVAAVADRDALSTVMRMAGIRGHSNRVTQDEPYGEMFPYTLGQRIFNAVEQGYVELGVEGLHILWDIRPIDIRFTGKTS